MRPTRSGSPRKSGQSSRVPRLELRRKRPGTVSSKTLELVQEEIQPALKHLLLSIEALSEEIQEYDEQIEVLADEKYPISASLTQVHGVGKLTAMAYLLTVEDRGRFRSSRTAGAYFGLVPRRDQYG